MSEIPTLIPPPKPSSSVLGIGFDKQNNSLFVEFKGTGVYKYYDFLQKDYDKLLKAESTGKHISKEVVPNFYYEKVK